MKPIYKHIQKVSWFEAFFSSLMIGAGETYFQAYALSLGQSEVNAGLLSAWPMLVGATLQLLSLWGVTYFQSIKRWVLMTAVIQALSFIPMIVLGFQTESASFTHLFLMMSLYWLGSFAVNPAWTVWISKLISPEQSLHFFSIRVRFSQIGLLTGLFAGGLLLQSRTYFGLGLSETYALLFSVALLARGLSVALMFLQKDFQFSWAPATPRHLKNILSRFWGNQHQRKFLVALPFYILSVNISAPFVAPYLLSELQFTPVQYMWTLACLFSGKFLTIWLVKKYKPNWSSFQILACGVLIAAPGPIMWAVSPSIVFVMLLQFYSGLGWGLYELGLQLIFFKDLNEEEKVDSMTIYQFLNSFAILMGSFLGAQYLLSYGATKDHYWSLFIFAGLVRFLCGYLLVLVLRAWGRATAQKSLPTS
jgi:predicted MFS family arabinose efflux permease